ncbi:capsule biosynthesis protein [Paracoccus sp. NSM]
MTTPPKARRYHASASEAIAPDEQAAAANPPGAADPGPVRVEVTRRQPQAPQSGTGDDGADMMARLSGTQPVDDGFGSLGPKAQTAADPDLEVKLAAIRDENLSERNLRIARRIAALHQIPVSSDEEAILRLRERGIDPSQRATIGKVLSGEGATGPEAAPGAAPKGPRGAKSLVPVGKTKGALTADGGERTMPLPSREALTEEKRAAEIYRIQRDLARRRRKRMMMLAIRLLVFVFLPTAAVSWYYTMIASPLYATVSQFQIQSADGNSGGGIGGLLGAGGMSANTDSVGVQSYLTSREAMMRLNDDLGFTRAFQDPAMDAVRRLPEDATNEAAFRVYQNSVKIGYDPTEGVLNMEVIAPDPELSREFSLALIRYAEEQVDRFTARLREDQMRGAIENYEDAEAKMLQAQRRVQELQEQLGVLDPQAESSVVMGQISSLEGQLTNRQLELGQLLSNPSPVQSRVDAARGDIERLQQQIAQTRQQLTEGNELRRSLTAITGELRVAEAELLTRQELLGAAAGQMEVARIEANKQVRYLSLSVAPVAPDEATYPKAFQNSIVAFLLFAGIYLMLSLTASILREQVST